MNVKDLIAEVRAHDVSANPGPWDLAWPTCITTGGQHGDTIADGCPEDDAALIAHYRTAAPILATEVERLNLENAARGAEVRRLTDDLKHVSAALGERLRLSQTPESAIARLIGDLEACQRERDAYQREHTAIRAALTTACIPAEAPLVDGVKRLASLLDSTEAERNAYRKAKAENDERFQIERDEARRDRDAFEARAQAYDALLTVAATTEPAAPQPRAPSFASPRSRPSFPAARETRWPPPFRVFRG